MYNKRRCPCINSGAFWTYQKDEWQISSSLPTSYSLSFQCIIHQGSLYKVGLDFKHAMDPVIQTVKVIRSRGLQLQSISVFTERHGFLILWSTLPHQGKVAKFKKRVKESLGAQRRNCNVFKWKIYSVTSTQKKKKEKKNIEWVCNFALAADIIQKRMNSTQNSRVKKFWLTIYIWTLSSPKKSVC